MPAQIRKLVVQIDETHREMDREVQPPTRRALAMAVIHNPCAGRYVENLDELIAIGEELGGLKALNFYHRRAAVQASTTVLSALNPPA